MDKLALWRNCIGVASIPCSKETSVCQLSSSAIQCSGSRIRRGRRVYGLEAECWIFRKDRKYHGSPGPEGEEATKAHCNGV